MSYVYYCSDYGHQDATIEEQGSGPDLPLGARWIKTCAGAKRVTILHRKLLEWE